MSNMKKRFYRIINGILLRSKNIYLVALALFCYCCRVFRLKNNKIVFSSFSGRSFSDSPAAISGYLLKKYHNMDIVWLINRNVVIDIPKGIRRVDNDSFKGIYELSTAKVWVDSHLKFWWHRKRKKQVYIQTFHGCIAIKKVDADAPNRYGRQTINRDKYNAKIIDYYISNSLFCDRMYRSALLFEGEIKRLGCPRNDIFFSADHDLTQKVRDKLGISYNKRILLYAPTFRNDDDISSYDMDYKRLLGKLKQTCFLCDEKKNDWVIIIRLHPLISNRAKDLNIFNGDIVDATSYENMQELEYASDVIITDYSSCIFDAAIMNKIGFLYASDYTSFVNDRGIYWDYFDLPFPVAQTNDQLNEIIDRFDLETYLFKIQEFKKDIDLFEDGNATKRVSELILEMCYDN